MADLEGKTIAATYESLLNVGTANNQNLDGTPRVIADGVGTASALYLATDEVLINSTNHLTFNATGSGEYIYGDGTDLRLYSGADILLVSTGKVGMGTLTPQHLLQVSTGGAGTQGGISVTSAADNTRFLNIMTGNSDVSSIIWDDADDLAFGVATSATATAPANVRMTITQEGYVGIGTTGPVGFINATGSVSGAWGYSLINTANDGNGLYVQGGGDDGTRYVAQFADRAAAVRMTILDTGEVGIGVADPDAALEVFNTGTQLKLSYDATDFCTFAVDTNHDLTVTPSSTGQIILKPTTDSVDFFQVLDADGGTPILNVDSTNERVGIGTPTPSYILHVADTQSSSFVGLLNNTSTATTADCLRLIIAVADGAATTGNVWISCEDANSAEMQIRGDGAGEITVQDTSDRRVKENIIDIPDALTMVGNLKPCRYNRKNVDASKYIYGFIADEFSSVFPNSISGTPDGTKVNDDGETVPDYQMISTKNVLAVLTKAVQELSAKVEALENA